MGWAVAASVQAAPPANLERAEQLAWMDPPAALQLLDKLQPSAERGEALVHWLMVRGIAAAAADDPQQSQAIVVRLQQLGRTEPAAQGAAHIVQAYLYIHGDQYQRAETELRQIGPSAALPFFERYRMTAALGSVQMFSGRNEAAVASYEQFRDMANTLQSESLMFEAATKLSGVYLTTRNLERADAQIAQMRAIAQRTGDEAQWVEVLTLENEIAQERGDRATERRALLEALHHAQLANSDRSKAMVLIDLASFSVDIDDYAAALDYSTQADALAGKLRRPLFQWLARSSMGMAHVGLGHLPQGKLLVEDAIQQASASGDLFDTDSIMRDYMRVLEKEGDLRGALDVGHREEKMREQLAASSRQAALLELSAKFDDERRARQIELLERDNAIKGRDLQAQRLRQQMMVIASALIVLACGALAWGITRIRSVNARLMYYNRQDALTGLLNRRYFNEHILTQHGNRPYVGCLLMFDLDHFQQINDTFGLAAGDAVLLAMGRRLSDVLPDRDALVRWSGEEFLAMLGPMSDAQLNSTVRRLLSALRSEPVNWNGQDLQCTVSIGYASFPLGGAAVDVSLDRAITLVNKALHQAKRRGRDRACLIALVTASTEQELSAINARFEEAAADCRVQLAETRGATA